MASKTSPEIQEQSHIVRVVAAALEIKTPSPKEVTFRGALLRKAASEINQLKPAFIVRLYEAACAVDFADDDVKEFRISCQAALSAHLGLSDFRQPSTPRQ